MKTLIISALVLAAVLSLAGFLLYRRAPEPDVVELPSATQPVTTPPDTRADATHAGFLYGRVITADGAVYQGRLRWGGGEEAFWSDTFNGYKEGNPWARLVPPEQLLESRQVSVFGIQIAKWQRQVELGRPLMVRFGDISRIEVAGIELRVTVKSGTVFRLDRFDADDLADGLRVWDESRGVVDLEEWPIRSVELLPTARLDDPPERLYGTVTAVDGRFTGFVQWDRRHCVGSDELVGHGADGSEVKLRFDSLRSIARRTSDSSLVTLRDGREVELSGSRDVGRDNFGVFVDDPRYGRVLVSWDAFQRLDFSPAGPLGSGRAYDDFPPGRPLTGSVTTRDGRSLAGRLVYDLDETETTESLDAPHRGVNYSLPFDLVASITLGEDADYVRVTLRSDEELQLERSGDLGERNAGLLVFATGSEQPDYVPWPDVERIDIEPQHAASRG